MDFENNLIFLEYFSRYSFTELLQKFQRSKQTKKSNFFSDYLSNLNVKRVVFASVEKKSFV